MADLPTYLQNEQAEEVIHARMLAAITDELDKSQGGFVWDMTRPAAIELALAAAYAQEVLAAAFPFVPGSRELLGDEALAPYAEARGAERAIFRKPAQLATGVATFSGDEGAVIPINTTITTATVGTVPSQQFRTTVEATIPSGGTVDVPIVAVFPGAAGNVAAESITMFSGAFPTGVTGVTNQEPTAGGADIEGLGEYIDRYLLEIRTPAAGGARGDYLRWAREVPGVGAAGCIPVEDGPGTVSVYVADSTVRPAGQTLIDAVQEHIAPPWTPFYEAEAMTFGTGTVVLDTDEPGAYGNSVRLEYDVAAPSTLTHEALEGLLVDDVPPPNGPNPEPGIWRAQVRLKVDSVSATSDLLQIGIWDVDTAAWAELSASDPTPAVTTFAAADLAVDWIVVEQQFYYQGTHQLELRCTRQQTDTSTIVWVDRVVYRSRFSRDTGEGLAPVGATVTVRPPAQVDIDITADLTYAPGFDKASVKSAIESRLEAYIQSLAFARESTTANDPVYSRIEVLIRDTNGVQDIANLLVNSGTANVAVQDNELAVLTSAVFTP